MLRSSIHDGLSYLIISLFGATLVSSIQKEILSKPFSYCLPGHVAVCRRFCFRVGIVLNGLLGLIFVFHPEVELSWMFLVVMAGGVVGMLLYSICIYDRLYGPNDNKIGTVIWVCFALLVLFKGYDKHLLDMIVAYPLVVLVAGTLFCWLIWKKMDIESFRRKYCGKAVAGVSGAWNVQNMQKVKEAKLAEKKGKKKDQPKVSSLVEDYFIKRIRLATSQSVSKHAWGSLYKSFGLIFSQGKDGLLFFLAMLMAAICFVCYLPGNGKIVVFIFPVLMLLHVRLWVHSSLSITSGRHERFWSALVLGGTVGLLVTAITILFVGLSCLLETVLPPLTIGGNQWVSAALNIKYCVLPLILAPITLMFGLVSYRRPLMKIVFPAVIFPVAIFLNTFLSIKDISIVFGPVYVVLLVVFSWGLFAGVLRYVSMRCCLVK